MQKDKRILLFVYGTLKRGGYNSYLLKKAKFLGEGETLDKFAMYVNGSGSVPFVIKNEKVSTIKGELYEVDKKTLKEVDSLEGHPFFYKREKVQVRLKDSGEVVEAWMYFWRKAKFGILKEDGFFNVRGENLRECVG